MFAAFGDMQRMDLGPDCAAMVTWSRAALALMLTLTYAAPGSSSN